MHSKITEEVNLIELKNENNKNVNIYGGKKSKYVHCVPHQKEKGAFIGLE